MNKNEACQLLELIQLSYPYAYQNMDNRRRIATIRMWAASFPQVPYAIIEECFNNYRMENRYAPTVADLNKELRRYHDQAARGAEIHRFLGNPETEAHFRSLMAASTNPTNTWLNLPEGFESYGIGSTWEEDRRCDYLPSGQAL